LASPARRIVTTVTVALAVCSAGNISDVGEILVREGYAVNFALDHGGYPAAEREAQSARRGLWQGEFESPRNWRRRHLRAG
jgi:endonuclease YncB( thermonuclease family)